MPSLTGISGRLSKGFVAIVLQRQFTTVFAIVYDPANTRSPSERTKAKYSKLIILKRSLNLCMGPIPSARS